MQVPIHHCLHAHKKAAHVATFADVLFEQSGF
jgi:hypothetical protein